MDIKVPPVATRLDPRWVKVNRRSPVVFRAFEIRDPATGRKTARGTLLTLPNGKRMTAEAYYAELNKLEREFTPLGYSLRDPEETIKLQETLVPRFELRRQVEKTNAAHLKLAPDRAPRFRKLSPEVIRQLDREHQEESEHDAERIKMIRMTVRPAPTSPPMIRGEHRPLPTRRPMIRGQAVPAAKTTRTQKTWSDSFGDPEVFSASIEVKLELTGTKEVTTLTGEAEAGGSIFDHRTTFLRATGSLRAPQEGPMNAKVNVTIVGQSVFNLDQNVNASWTKTEELNKTFDESTTVNFPLGPIPIGVTIGAQGSAGIAYWVGLRPASAKAEFTPQVSSRAYAQAGVDLGVGGAGAGADMTLLDDEMHLSGEVAVKLDDSNRPYFFEKFSCHNELEVLSGDVYAYVFVYVPRFGVPPWKKKQWNWDIFSWEGFKTDGYIFNEENKTYLY